MEVKGPPRMALKFRRRRQSSLYRFVFPGRERAERMYCRGVHHVCRHRVHLGENVYSSSMKSASNILATSRP